MIELSPAQAKPASTDVGKDLSPGVPEVHSRPRPPFEQSHEVARLTSKCVAACRAVYRYTEGALSVLLGKVPR
jgi:hypothetical protein